jgi:kynurenine formamidase
VHAIDDEPFDAAAVEAGAWPSPYGDGDTLGTYVEVTPRKSAAALRSLAASEATGVRTFNLGETLFDGYPAFGTRTYSLAVRGSGFASSAHAETARSRPWGPNRLTSLEERVEFSFNLGAKINGLAHCGVGDRLYAGRSLAAYVADGSRQLDTTTFGSPLVTRGLLFDVLGFYVAHDRDDALSHTVDGEAIVRDDHRITVEDLEACAAWAGLGEVEPGDAVVLRTGWRRLLRSDPQRYLRSNPGVFLRETRWLAQFRPALVGADTWCFETIDPAVTGPLVSPCHQELFVRFGIRLGECLALDDLAAAGVTQFVFCHAPLPAVGAVSSNAPAIALAPQLPSAE